MSFLKKESYKMKRLLIGLICVATLANANTSLKFKACNYTLDDGAFFINNADNINVDGTDYTQYTGNVIIGTKKISAEHCADIPIISTIDGTVLPYMQVAIATTAVDASLNMLAIQDINGISSAVIQSYLGAAFPTYILFLHAVNNGNNAYYNMYTFESKHTPNNEEFNGLSGQYDYELYLCDARQLNPCNGNDELNNIVRGMKVWNA